MINLNLNLTSFQAILALNRNNRKNHKNRLSVLISVYGYTAHYKYYITFWRFQCSLSLLQGVLQYGMLIFRFISKLGFLDLFRFWVGTSFPGESDSLWCLRYWGRNCFQPFQPVLNHSSQCQRLLMGETASDVCSWMTKTDAQELCEEVFPWLNIGVYISRTLLSSTVCD